jgi:drug/metabolite transporter (DMT)-like permease
VCTAVMARFFLGERMTRIRWASFAAAIAGVLLCSGINFGALDFSGTFLAGNLLIFAGLNGSAFYNSYGKKVLERYSPMAMLFWTYVAMMVLLTPVTLASEWEVFSRVPAFTAGTWTGLILLTFFHNFLSMVLFLRALHVLDATQAALSNYLITFFGLPISAIWLGEQLTPMMIAGGIAVLISTLAITLWDRQPA